MKITNKTMDLINVATFFDYERVVEALNTGLFTVLENKINTFREVHKILLMKKYHISFNDELVFEPKDSFISLEKKLSKNIISELNRINKVGKFMFFDIPEDDDLLAIQFVKDFIWYLDAYKEHRYVK